MFRQSNITQTSENNNNFSITQTKLKRNAQNFRFNSGFGWVLTPLPTIFQFLNLQRPFYKLNQLVLVSQKPIHILSISPSSRTSERLSNKTYTTNSSRTLLEARHQSWVHCCHRYQQYLRLQARSRFTQISFVALCLVVPHACHTFQLKVKINDNQNLLKKYALIQRDKQRTKGEDTIRRANSIE